MAREAAVLLYESQEQEYSQAKKKAAQTLGVRILPSNREVAEELDSVAEEREGPVRRQLLITMREEALQIMEALSQYAPKLVGSVWRGTAHKASDIDIVAFSSNAQLPLEALKNSGFHVVSSERSAVTKHGAKQESFHIYLAIPSGNEAEVTVRSPEQINQPNECEIYGDAVTGLTYSELHQILNKNPLQKFLPK